MMFRYASVVQEVHESDIPVPGASASIEACTSQFTKPTEASTTLITSTPAPKEHSRHEETCVPMSDFSDIEAQSSHSSDLSGIEAMQSDSEKSTNASLLSRYQQKAKEAEDTSFIEISLVGGSASENEPEEEMYQRDPTYSPSQSEIEEEEEFDMDLDLELEMSLSILQTHLDTEPLHLPMAEDPIGIEEDPVDDELRDEDNDPLDTDTETDAVGEKKSICFQSALLELASIRIPTNCQRKACGAEISVRCRYVGCAIQMKWTCSNGHHVHTWDSQPRIKKVYAGNFLLSAAILISGNNFAKVALLAKFLNLAMIGITSHHRVQRVFTAPVINNYFEEMMRTTLEKYRGKDIVVAGDGRNDSPGHSAMYCTYTFIEYESKDIVACQIVDKRMTQLKSTLMEKEGMIRAMETVFNAGANIKEICTDAHVQIAHYLKTTYPDVKHSYDTWHGAKNLGKKLTAIAAEARNKELRPWIQDLINHFWYCSRKAQGDELALLSRWRGILHHVTNTHEWELGDGSGPAECEHAPLPDPGPDVETKWLDPESDAHHALEKFVFDTRLLHTLQYYVNFRHTGELENFHENILMYAAKRFAYSYPMYKARNQLAAIDYQKHKDRQHAKTKSGEPMYARKYSKRNKNWSAVPIKEPKQYKYVADILRNALDALERHEGPLPTRFPLEESDPRQLKRTIAEVSPIPTKELVLLKKSRFQD
ncbi:uncharacterized protein [Argopecten irradians]|uniref:uncharacterized protein n=1 Tax=Argopecten irradians TaxID=31199 RepID=UPI00370F7F36